MFDDQDAHSCADTLGGRISLARDAKAISVEEAARRLGVLASSWNAWERDRAVPRANRLTMMAGVLGVSPSWLLTGRGKGPLDETADSDRADLRPEILEMLAEAKALNERLLRLTLRLERQIRAPAQ